MSGPPWPKVVDISDDDARRNLRSMELSAYSSLLATFRAQGDLTNEKRSLLEKIRELLSISGERHRAEIRKSVNDEKLSTVAFHLVGPNHDSEWRVESRRLAPLAQRLALQSAFTCEATNAANLQAEKNAMMSLPGLTGNKEQFMSAGTLLTPPAMVSCGTSSPSLSSPAYQLSTAPVTKYSRPQSPNTNVVLLPSGTSIHIKGNVAADDDEDITGTKRRRLATTETSMASNKQIVGRGQITPLKLTLNKSTVQTSGSQKVILVQSSSGQTMSSTSSHVRRPAANTTVPIVKSVTPIISHQRTSVVYPASESAPISSVGPSIHTHQGLTIQRPRPKATLTTPRLTASSIKPSVTVSRHGVVIPASGNATSIPRTGVHVKQEGAMKIITSSTNNKLLPRPSTGINTPIVVVTSAGASHSTSNASTSLVASASVNAVITRPGGSGAVAINNNKVISIHTGGKVINASPGQRSVGQRMPGAPLRQISNISTSSPANTGKSGNVVIVQQPTHSVSVKSSAAKLISSSTPFVTAKPAVSGVGKSSFSAVKSSPSAGITTSREFISFVQQKQGTTPLVNKMATALPATIKTLSASSVINKAPEVSKSSLLFGEGRSNSQVIVTPLTSSTEKSVKVTQVSADLKASTDSAMTSAVSASDSQHSEKPEMDIFSSALAEADICLDPYEFIDEDEPVIASTVTSPTSVDDSMVWSTAGTDNSSSGVYQLSQGAAILSGELPFLPPTASVSADPVASHYLLSTAKGEPVVDNATSLLAQASTMLSQASQLHTSTATISTSTNIASGAQAILPKGKELIRILPVMPGANQPSTKSSVGSRPHLTVQSKTSTVASARPVGIQPKGDFTSPLIDAKILILPSGIGQPTTPTPEVAGDGSDTSEHSLLTSTTATVNASKQSTLNAFSSVSDGTQSTHVMAKDGALLPRQSAAPEPVKRENVKPLPCPPYLPWELEALKQAEQDDTNVDSTSDIKHINQESETSPTKTLQVENSSDINAMDTSVADNPLVVLANSVDVVTASNTDTTHGTSGSNFTNTEVSPLELGDTVSEHLEISTSYSSHALGSSQTTLANVDNPQVNSISNSIATTSSQPNIKNMASSSNTILDNNKPADTSASLNYQHTDTVDSTAIASHSDEVTGTSSSPISASPGEEVDDTVSPPLAASPGEEVDDTVNPPLAASPGKEVDDTVNPPLAASPGEEVDDTVSPPLAASPGEEVSDTAIPPLAASPDEEVDDTVSPPLAASPGEEVNDTVNPPLAASLSEEVDDTVNPPLAVSPDEEVDDTVNPPLSASLSEEVDDTVNPPIDASPGEEVDDTVNPPLAASPGEEVGDTVIPPLAASPDEEVGDTVSSPLAASPGEEVDDTVNPPLAASPGEEVGDTVIPPLAASPDEEVDDTVSPPLAASPGEEVNDTVIPPLAASPGEEVDDTVNPPLAASPCEKVTDVINPLVDVPPDDAANTFDLSVAASSSGEVADTFTSPDAVTANADASDSSPLVATFLDEVADTVTSNAVASTFHPAIAVSPSNEVTSSTNSVVTATLDTESVDAPQLTAANNSLEDRGATLHNREMNVLSDMMITEERLEKDVEFPLAGMENSDACRVATHSPSDSLTIESATDTSNPTFTKHSPNPCGGEISEVVHELSGAQPSIAPAVTMAECTEVFDLLLGLTGEVSPTLGSAANVSEEHVISHQVETKTVSVESNMIAVGIKDEAPKSVEQQADMVDQTSDDSSSTLHLTELSATTQLASAINSHESEDNYLNETSAVVGVNQRSSPLPSEPPTNDAKDIHSSSVLSTDVSACTPITAKPKTKDDQAFGMENCGDDSGCLQTANNVTHNIEEGTTPTDTATNSNNISQYFISDSPPSTVSLGPSIANVTTENSFHIGISSIEMCVSDSVEQCESANPLMAAVSHPVLTSFDSSPISVSATTSTTPPSIVDTTDSELKSGESCSDSSPPLIARRHFEKVYRPRNSRSLSAAISVSAADVSPTEKYADESATNGSGDISSPFANPPARSTATDADLSSNNSEKLVDASSTVGEQVNAIVNGLGPSEHLRPDREDVGSEEWLTGSGHSLSNGPLSAEDMSEEDENSNEMVNTSTEKVVRRGRKRRRKSDQSPLWCKAALGLLKRVMVFRGANRSKGEHGAAAWFLKPVSDDEAPGYSTVISQPMDFGTVKRKLEASVYPSLEHFKADMMLVYTNCCTYNPPEHNVRRDCELVFIYFRQEYEKLLARLQLQMASKRTKVDSSEIPDT